LTEVSSKFCKRFMSLFSTEEETWFIGHSTDQFPRISVTASHSLVPRRMAVCIELLILQLCSFIP
jgi:hypothetical protein